MLENGSVGFHPEDIHEDCRRGVVWSLEDNIGLVMDDESFAHGASFWVERDLIPQVPVIFREMYTT